MVDRMKGSAGHRGRRRRTALRHAALAVALALSCLMIGADPIHAVLGEFGDFEGDGKADLGVFVPVSPASATWFVLLSSGGTRGAIQGTSDDVPIVGDFDGDGLADRGTFRPGTRRWEIQLSGGGSIVRFIGPFGGQTIVPAPAAYYGATRTYIGQYDQTNGIFFVVPESIGGGTVTIVGLPGSIPVPADYDGDGKADLAVWLPSTGAFYAILSTGGTASAPIGQQGDIPVMADYDGDNRADLAIFRPSTGQWFAVLSGGGVASQVVGQQGDIPIPADYDGDNRADVAIYRPSSGLFFVVNSTGGATAAILGDGGDVPLTKRPSLPGAYPFDASAAPAGPPAPTRATATPTPSPARPASSPISPRSTVPG